MRYLRANWPHLLLTLLGSAISTAFALGFAWASLGDRVANAEWRLDDIDNSHVAETRWQVHQNTAALLTLNADARHTDAEMAKIETRLGVLDAKLDAIAAALKSRP